MFSRYMKDTRRFHNFSFAQILQYSSFLPFLKALIRLVDSLRRFVSHTLSRLGRDEKASSLSQIFRKHRLALEVSLHDNSVNVFDLSALSRLGLTA